MLSFILPNKKLIDFEGVIDALEDTSGTTRYFLDSNSGNVGCISSTDIKSVAKLKNNPVYFEVPVVSLDSQVLVCQDFLDTFIKTGSKKEKVLYTKLQKVLNTKEASRIDTCLSLMSKVDESLIAGWTTWQSDHLFEVMKTWFGTLPVKIEESFSGDDDCLHCKSLDTGVNQLTHGQLGGFRMAMKTQDKNDLYYEAMEAMNRKDGGAAITMLLQALQIDPDYVQTHHGLSAIYREMKNMEKYREHTIKAYDNTLKQFKKWPQELSWYDIDNRQYHRAIFFRAGLHIEDGEIEKGIALYRQLLSMCPNDNLGARYWIAGLYASKSMKEIDRLWHKSNNEQNWDAMENMLKEQNSKHSFWKNPGQEN